MPDPYKGKKFKVLNKKSSSPSLIIIINDPKKVIKVWFTDDNSEETQSLNYEMYVYQNKIRPILQKDPTLPFLDYLDARDLNVEQLEKNIGITDIDSQLLWISVFFIFFQERDSSFDYGNAKHITKYMKKFGSLANVDINKVYNLKLRMLVLPFMNAYPLHSILPNLSTAQMISVIKEIIRGIQEIYRSGLIHNIMIDKKTSKVLIFDWDRGYIKNKNNPFLDTKRCGGDLCSFSQCNIYNREGYAIDLYKILYYIFKARDNIDIETILSRVFKIMNRFRNPDNQNKIIASLTRDYCFRKDDCTFLQYPDDQMSYVISQFGSIYEIYAKATDMKIANKQLSEFDINLQMERSLNMLREKIKSVSGFKSIFKFKQNTKIPKFKQDTEIHNLNLFPKITKKYKLMAKSTNTDNEIRSEIRRITNIPKGKETLFDLVRIRNLLEYIDYGSPIRQKEIMFMGSKFPSPIPITDIMVHNEKIKIRKK